GLHDVGDPALAGLRVHPDHGLVRATDVLRVDRQVRHGPQDLVRGLADRGRIPLQVLETLLDRILVRAGEGRVDQVAAIRVPGVNRQLVAVLHSPANLVDVTEVDLRVNSLREQVHAQRDQAYVARALAISEQAALDAVCPGLVAQL